MKSIKFLAIAIMAAIFSIAAYGQDEERGKTPPAMPPQRPSTYQLVDEVRNALGLDNKEFEKVYSAYKNYSKTVFGDEDSSQNQQPRQGGRPGGPGGMGGPGGPGGMGGPGGGGRPPRGEGGMGRPDGGFGQPQEQMGRPGKMPSAEDMEKFEKTKAKAEEKLCKTIKKLFKKDPAKYDKWLEVRKGQLDGMFRPEPPRHDRDARND